MKKNYFMLAATAALFAACAETDLVNEIAVEETPQAISFETFANKATRADGAENSGATYTQNDLSNHHTSFYVWASKLVADNTEESPATKYEEVYKDAEPGTVTYSSSPSGWTATPLKYWDKTATSYEFYAAAPAVQNTTNPAYGWDAANTNGADGYLTFNNFVLYGSANDNLASSTANTESWANLNTSDTKDIDLMIAAPCKVSNTNYNTTTPSAVNLDFIHILSRLNINVMATTTSKIVEGVTTYSPNIKLTALNVVGLKNKGSFNENASLQIGEKVDDTTGENTPINAELGEGTHLRWQNTTEGSVSPSSAGTYTLAAHLGFTNDQPSTALQLTSTAQATHKYLIIPQLVENKSASANVASAPGEGEAYIQIKYTVDDEPFEAYYSLAQAFGIAEDATLAFNEGWQNTLNITISPNAIIFTGSVAKWADKNNNENDQNTSGDNAAID